MWGNWTSAIPQFEDKFLIHELIYLWRGKIDLFYGITNIYEIKSNLAQNCLKI